MLIDVNVNYGVWPFRKFHENSLSKMSRCLKEEGISFGLISSLEAVFQDDVKRCNDELFRKLNKYPNLLPVAVINPKNKDWKQILEQNNYKAVKIFPGYHNYSLFDENAMELIKAVNLKKVPLLISIRQEDERIHNPVLKVKSVKPEEIKKIAVKFRDLTIVTLCACFAEAAHLAAIPNIYTEISFTESYDTLSALTKKIPAGKILFGSNTPFLCARSAIMKLKYNSISRKDRKSIAYKNSAGIFKI